jgi:ATP-binding cassette subfamily B protein
MMIYPLLDLPQLFVSGKQAFVNIDRLNEMKDFPTFNSYDTIGSVIEQFDSLSFDKVGCHYPDKEEPVLNNVTFTLSKNEKMLVLGSTGCGKTTIANMIMGLVKPSTGSILINYMDLSHVNIDSLRELVSFVPQESSLFSGTIKENILLANTHATDIEYNLAIESSQLKHEIAEFPEHDNTLVGQRGLSVSGGQKQRITIARALIKNPQLLILDDITASLDAENEEKLWKSINKEYPTTSAIVISHRLSTLHYVDSVLFIDSHGVSHKDKHEALVFNNKEYHDFLHEHLKN